MRSKLILTNLSYLFFFAFCWIFQPAFAQHNFPSKLFADQFQFLSNDTVKFYLSSYSGKLMGKDCADIYRIAKVNQYFQFDGEVFDSYVSKGSKFCLATYRNGVKEGTCTYYFENGQVKETGSYANNMRAGIWTYYFENGLKHKTIEFMNDKRRLLECFNITGDTLATNGMGRFSGEVTIGTAANPILVRMEGPVKNGIIDGEWRIYNKHLKQPNFVEKFSNGFFISGISNSAVGTSTYKQQFQSSFESIHVLDMIDYYSQTDWCLIKDKPSILPKYASSLSLDRYFEEMGDGLKDILSSDKYANYSGWIFLNTDIDKNGKVADAS
ncbi:MAG TPA: hypothetical protein VFH08_05335, partial [Chitinophagaceae bacterium]|nr:hypothetical protein [Chitinophagaceae bacterium]